MTIYPTESTFNLSSLDFLFLLDELTLGSFYYDIEADIVQWSKHLHASLGYSAEQTRKLQNIEDLIHPNDLQKHREVVSNSIANQEKYTIDIRLRDEAGDYHLLRVFGAWLKLEHSASPLLAGFLINFEDLAHSRRETARSEQLFQAFFENVPAAVYIKNPALNHLYGNQAAADQAGCSLEDFLNKPSLDLFDEETAKKIEEIDRRVLDYFETVTWHGELKSNTGQVSYTFDTKFPIVDPITNETRLGGIGIDTTRQHQMEQALAQRQKLEALGQLVGGIAHDFNNTLAILQGNLELVGIIEEEAEIADCLTECAKAVERGRRLTQQLLAFGRKSVMKTEALNLNEIISESDRMLRHILPENIQIETVLGGGIWNTRADKTQVENAIVNLALNARDAMTSGGRLTIETANIRIEKNYIEDRAENIQPGRYVMLAVSDTGDGMHRDVMERAFDPFFSTKSVDKGSGMGLAMVHGLISQLEGAARLYSELGIGTTVKLFFPTTHSDEALEHSPAKTLRAGTEHLLLAEDDDSVRNMLKNQLQLLGYRITEARSGDMAFERLKADPTIEMLVTDIVMPGRLQGPKLARAARNHRPDLPVLFMSGYPREASIHGNGLQPNDQILMKPVSFSDLANAIRMRFDTT